MIMMLWELSKIEWNMMKEAADEIIVNQYHSLPTLFGPKDLNHSQTALMPLILIQ